MESTLDVPSPPGPHQPASDPSQGLTPNSTTHLPLEFLSHIPFVQCPELLHLTGSVITKPFLTEEALTPWAL